MAGPSVSVVIPTHQRPILFRRALASVLAQSYTDIEVLVVDDSGINSAAQRTTQTYLDNEVTDERVRYLINETCQGVGAARNTGIRAARGDYVAFLDDDEDWLPTKLAKQVELFSNAPPEVGAVDTGFYDWKADGRCRIVLPKMQGWIFEQLLSKTGGRAPKLSTMLCRKEALLSCGLFDPELTAREDYDLYLRLARDYRFASIMEPLSNKRADAAARITDHVDRFVDGYAVIYAKLMDDFAKRPRSHAIFLLKYARALALAGRTTEAKQRYWQASRLQPLNPRLITYGYSIWRSARH